MSTLGQEFHIYNFFILHAWPLIALIQCLTNRVSFRKELVPLSQYDVELFYSILNVVSK
jgi:hypothetical protein